MTLADDAEDIAGRSWRRHLGARWIGRGCGMCLSFQGGQRPGRRVCGTSCSPTCAMDSACVELRAARTRAMDGPGMYRLQFECCWSLNLDQINLAEQTVGRERKISSNGLFFVDGKVHQIQRTRSLTSQPISQSFVVKTHIRTNLKRYHEDKMGGNMARMLGGGGI